MLLHEASSMTLIDAVRSTFRRLHYSPRTEEAYLSWIRALIHFHRCHPRDLSAAQITAFLNHLAAPRRVAASTQNQALRAVVFLYRCVLDLPMPELAGGGAAPSRGGRGSWGGRPSLCVASEDAPGGDEPGLAVPLPGVETVPGSGEQPSLICRRPCPVRAAPEGGGGGAVVVPRAGTEAAKASTPAGPARSGRVSSGDATSAHRRRSPLDRLRRRRLMPRGRCQARPPPEHGRARHRPRAARPGEGTPGR
jgi:hypothetical protein